MEFLVHCAIKNEVNTIEKKSDEEIIDLYLNSNIPVRELNDMCTHDLYRLLKENNIPSRRFYQKYELIEDDDIAYIYIKSKGETLKCIIDLEDVDKCKEIGIWSITKDGYIINCATGIYLHRLVMNCPKDKEVDHIYHNLLDNRKSQLRIATSSQQKMNTKRRVDNSSGNRGIYYDKSTGTWNININFLNQHFRKRFKNKENAIKMRDEIYKKGFGEYMYKTSPEDYNVDYNGANI